MALPLWSVPTLARFGTVRLRMSHIVLLLCVPVFLAGPALAGGKFAGRRCNAEFLDCKVACVAWERDRPGSLEGCRSDCAVDQNECLAGGGEASSVGPSDEPHKPDLPKQKQGGSLSVKP